VCIRFSRGVGAKESLLLSHFPQGERTGLVCPENEIRRPHARKVEQRGRNRLPISGKGWKGGEANRREGRPDVPPGAGSPASIMTRARLELAISDKITPEAVKIELRLHKEADVTLAKQIQACEEKGWFNGEEVKVVRRIKNIGNDAAHGEPVLSGRPKDHLEDFSLVLRQLDAIKGEAASLD